jgi:hypothetical protein
MRTRLRCASCNDYDAISLDVRASLQGEDLLLPSYQNAQYRRAIGRLLGARGSCNAAGTPALFGHPTSHSQVSAPWDPFNTGTA